MRLNELAIVEWCGRASPGRGRNFTFRHPACQPAPQPPCCPVPALLLLQVGHGDEALAVFHDMLGPGSAARPTGEAGSSAGSVLAWLRGWQVDRGACCTR